MTIEPPIPQDSPEDERFAIAIDEYYRRLKVHGVVDQQEFLWEFADIQDALEEFLADADQVDLLLSKSESEASTQPVPNQLGTLRYVGDYELISEIARGGMGVIYQACQRSLGRIVAVKMILAGQLASADDVVRFRNEAMAVAKLQHPNIVGIYEVGDHEGQQFFSMEYVDGRNLAELVKESLFEARKAAQTVQTIAQALAFIHGKGLLHRDLKSSNVLIERNSGTVRITDFGLSKRTDTTSLFTSVGEVLGTPSYMSPEQAAGRNELVGVGSDVYSLGAILYELVTGRPPFRGETPWETAWQVINSDVVAPSKLRMKLPRDLETICLKCLSKSVALRYLTAQELADDLGRFIRGEPIRARPVRRLERCWRWCRRNPALAFANAMAGLGFLGLLISLLIFASSEREHSRTLTNALDESESRRISLNLRLSEAQRDRGIQLCKQGEVDQGCLWLARSLETAPEDSLALRRSIRLNLGAWQRELCTLRAIFPGSGAGLAFSPDSQRFATTNGKSCVVRESVTGNELSSSLHFEPVIGKILFGTDPDFLVLSTNKGLQFWRKAKGVWREKLIPAKQGGIHGLCVTTENRVLDAYSRPDGIHIEDAETDERVGGILPSDIYNPDKVFFGPDGKYAVTQPKRGQLVLSDLKAGRTVGNPMKHPGRVEFAAFSSDGQRLATCCVDEAGQGRKLQIQVWDTATAEKQWTSLPLENETTFLDDVFFAEGGRRLFLATYANKLRVWDRAGNLMIGPVNGVGRIRGTEDGRLVAYVSAEGEGRLLDVDTQKTIGQPLGRFRGSRCQIAISPNGAHLLVETQQDTRLWSVPQRGLKLLPFDEQPANLKRIGLLLSEDGQTLLNCDAGGNRTTVWNVTSGKLRGQPLKGAYGIGCFAMSANGRWAVTGSGQKYGPREIYQSIYLWNLQTGNSVFPKLPQHKYHTSTVAFTADGKRLVSVGDYGVIFVYNIEKGELVAGPLEHPGLPELKDSRKMRLSISPDQQKFAVFSKYEDSVTVWSLTGERIGEPLQTLPGLTCVAFSPDGQSLVTAGEQIQVWNGIGDRRSVRQLDCPSPVTAVAYHPEGHLLAIAHEDRFVRIWDLESERLIGRPLQSEETIHHLAFSSDGQLLVTCVATGAFLYDPITAIQVGPKFVSTIYCTVRDGARAIAGGVGSDVRLWHLPDASSDDAGEAMKRVEVDTGLTLDADDLVQPLSPEAWEKIRQP
ncbi:MAG: repeat-containing protein [Planctomycetaceae bacterium]|nr:repeat-containing protein [Planctomycetaceae bacterium]